MSKKPIEITKIFKILAVFPALFSCSCSIKTKDNPKEYVELLNEFRSNVDFHTELYIFPENINDLEVKAFQASSREDLFNGSYLFYLVLKLDEIKFVEEIDRISNIEAMFLNNESKKILSYPEEKMFLTIYKDYRYEYVLYNEESNEIAYVSNQLFNWADVPIVKSEHIIDNPTIPESMDDGSNSYNMYYWIVSNVGFYINEEIK